MKQIFATLTVVTLAVLAGAVFYSTQPGAQGTRPVLEAKADSAANARTDSLDAQLRPDSLVTADSMPKLITETKPVYPEAALKTGAQGVIWIKALISRNGNVLKATAMKNESGNAALEQAALAAATQNKYRPARVNGKPVAVWVTYKVNFKLDDKPATPSQKPAEGKK